MSKKQEIPAESMRIDHTSPKISLTMTNLDIKFSCQGNTGDVEFFAKVIEIKEIQTRTPKIFSGKFTVSTPGYEPTVRYFRYFTDGGTGTIERKNYTPQKQEKGPSFCP